MVEFVVFCLPTIVYIVVLTRWQGRPLRTAMDRAGASWGTVRAYAWALALLVPLVLAGWLAIVLVPAHVLELPGVTIARLTSVAAGIAIVLRAAGEEVFFRGLLGGVLMRRLGFGPGNLAQSAVFMIPHLPLLLVDVVLWPLLPVQFAAGWLLGWLRHRVESFVPGAAVHAVANIAAGLLAA